MSNRDDFSAPVIRAVAARAGWHCSMCKKLTIGPGEEAAESVTNIGKAAHIAAAAPGAGARRYDAAMTREERAGISNAIWLCADHADLIDRDEVTYPVAKLHAMKRDHEQATARAVRTGATADLATGLLAIGPDAVCTGELSEISAVSWTVRLEHFVVGDLHALIKFIEGFAQMGDENRYILSNELGDGRIVTAAPVIKREAGAYTIVCPIAPATPRINAQSLGADIALDLQTNDMYLAGGDIAMVAGLSRLPQAVQMLLSINRGEDLFSPKFGMRFFEYFEAFQGSPWLDLLLKLDVIRQAAIPYRDKHLGKSYTLLQCVARVRHIELLAVTPVEGRLPVKIAFDVQGVGEWERELRIFMPTAEQMAERAKLRASKPWLSGAKL